MAVRFLSAEWAAAVHDALNAHTGFKNSIGNAELALQFNTSGAPSGDVSYYLKTAGGSASFALGAVEPADVTIGQTYETATAISKGDLNTQAAFMQGKLKLAGNLAKLMMHQSSITQWGAAVSGLDVDY